MSLSSLSMCPAPGGFLLNYALLNAAVARKMTTKMSGTVKKC
jgi:hypothetical protein